MSLDPFAGYLDEPGSLHKYLYVGNDPVNLTDPSGLAETASYTQRVKDQVRRTVNYLNRHGRDILCKTLDTSSIIVSILGGPAAVADVQRAADLFQLSLCPCTPGGGGGGGGRGVPTLFRGDRSSRTPDLIFKEGFKPKGNNTDLLQHAEGAKDSNYVATSKSRKVAEGAAGRNGYVWEIRSDRGVDVNKTLGPKSPHPYQHEVAFPGGIDPSEIVGAFPMRCGVPTGDFIPNPNFRGF